MSIKSYPIRETWSGTANITKTLKSAMKEFCIKNDGASDLTFTIGGTTITVKPGEIFDDVFAPFNSISIVTTVSYRALVRG
jgi:hypothetical protein